MVHDADQTRMSMTDNRSDAAATLRAENAALREEVDALRARLADVERLADSDTLTPLPNRRVFIREVERVAMHVSRYGSAAAVLFVDVDGLKSINDAHGHQAGDAALIHVAALLRRELRATDVVARIGGDEFGLLLDHLEEDAAAAKADQLIGVLRAEPLDLGSQSITIGISIGFTMVQNADSVDAIIARADAHMYALKAAQRSAR